MLRKILSALTERPRPGPAASEPAAAGEGPAATPARPMGKAWRSARRARFERVHGYAANLETPETFSEKLFTRILHPEDPHYPLYGSKLQSHYFVRAQAVAGLKVARHLKVVRRLDPSDFADLPEAFVMKSSFGSGLNKVVTSKAALDIAAECARFNDRLHSLRNAQDRTDPQNVVIFEEFIGDPATGVPDDYKFHCFHRADGAFSVFVQVDSDRFGDHRQTIFDGAFAPVAWQFARQTRHDVPPPRPAALADMLRIARALSTGFDYIRVDLFDTAKGVYFGEMTPFHQRAMAPILPVEWDRKVGQLWDQRFPTYQPPGPTPGAAQGQTG